MIGFRFVRPQVGQCPRCRSLGLVELAPLVEVSSEFGFPCSRPPGSICKESLETLHTTLVGTRRVCTELEELRVETLARGFASRMIERHLAAMVPIRKKKIRFIQMSLRFVGGAFRLKGAQTMKFVIDPPVLPGTPVEVPAVVEVPTAAPEPPAVVEVPTAAPEPPSKVETPAEVPEAAPEAGLVPEDPPAE